MVCILESGHYIIYKLILLAEIKGYLAASTGCPRKCQCLEGGIVVCQNKYLLDVPPNLPNDTQHLYIGANFIRKIRKDAFINVRSLRTLEISSNFITGIESGAFQYTERLTTLTIRDNLLPRIAKDTFKGLKNLQNLDLSNVAPDGIALCIEDEAFSDLKSLLTLNLDHNNIIGLTNMTLYGLQKLEHLDLSYNNIQLISSGAFVMIGSSSVIFDVTIKCCCSTVEAMKSIMGNTNGRCLKSCYDYPPHCRKVIQSSCSINIHPLYYMEHMNRDERIPKTSVTKYTKQRSNSKNSKTLQKIKNSNNDIKVKNKRDKDNKLLSPPSPDFNKNISLEIQKQLFYISNLHPSVSGLDKKGQWSIAIVTCVVFSISIIMILVAVVCKKRRFSYKMNLMDKYCQRQPEFVNCSKRHISIMDRYSPSESTT